MRMRMAGIARRALREIAIKPMFDAFMTALADEFAGLRDRYHRGKSPVAHSRDPVDGDVQQVGSIVLTTGNKREMAVGYATLYGDMAGGFAVLKDISKTLVYRLSNYRNSLSPVIPERIITRAPSAELRPTRPTRTACRRTTCSTPSWKPMSSTTRVARNRSARLSPERRRAGGPADPDQRIQAPPGAGRHSHHAARFRQGLALSDHVGVGRVEEHPAII